MEIADRYTNDSDVICKFTYNFDVPMASTSSDRIGFYRVPYFNPHEYLTFQWVSDAVKADQINYMVTFKASDLPKQEDFYQFQFLRTENGVESVMGASVPFQVILEDFFAKLYFS